VIAATSLASQAYAAIHPLLTPVLALATLHLPDVPPLGHVHELVDEPLAVHLGQDAPLVVVPQGPPHRLVVHVGLVLVCAPQAGHRLRVHQLEDAAGPVQPLDVGGAAGGVLQEAQEELPEEGRRGLLGLLPGLAGRPGWPSLGLHLSETQLGRVVEGLVVERVGEDGVAAHVRGWPGGLVVQGEGEGVVRGQGRGLVVWMD